MSFNPSRPEDKLRLYSLLSRPNENGHELVPPVSAQEGMYEKSNELYELVSQGKLLYELSDYDNIRQVRMEPDKKLIYDVKTEIIKRPEISRPVKYVLGFPKKF